MNRYLASDWVRVPVGISTLDQDGLHHGPKELLQTAAFGQGVAGGVYQHGPQGFLETKNTRAQPCHV